MLKHLACVAALLSILLWTPGTLLAKCLNFSAFPNNEVVLVLKGFTGPAKGACASVVGFTAGTTVTTNIPLSGSACTSSNGSELSITISGSNPQAGGNFFFGSATLSLPAKTGTYDEQDLASGSTSSNTGNPYSVSLGACPIIETVAAQTHRPMDGGADVPHGLLGLP
jgi:hypothetical protein